MTRCKASVGFGRAGGGESWRRAAIASIQTRGSDADQVGLAFYIHPGASGDTDLVEALRIKHDGNVGIGMTNPSQKLHVNGNIMTGYNSYLYLGGTDVYWQDNSGNLDGSSSSSINLDYDDNNNGTGTFQIKSGNSTVLKIDNAGNVGIGTTNPGSYKLAVKGKIRAEEVVVETGWSDFVFEEDYDLMPLPEVERYIAEHKHLPDVPSAEEVAADGLSLGETQALLLQKIEELTLYMIELDKENKVLKENYERIMGQLSGQIDSKDR